MLVPQLVSRQWCAHGDCGGGYMRRSSCNCECVGVSFFPFLYSPGSVGGLGVAGVARMEGYGSAAEEGRACSSVVACRALPVHPPYCWSEELWCMAALLRLASQ